MNNTRFRFLVTILFVCALSFSLPCFAIETQEMLAVRIQRMNPKLHEFIKDAPIAGYRLTSRKFKSIPDIIRKHLGAVDNTQYTEEYLAANLGTIIALQAKDNRPDFYLVGKDTFRKQYRIVSIDAVKAKNPKLIDRLNSLPGIRELINGGHRNIVGALKTVPVKMIRMSEIGYEIHNSVKIQSPWGEQTKPSGSDAFLVFDSGAAQYYMVNTDKSGLPISYVPAKK